MTDQKTADALVGLGTVLGLIAEELHRIRKHLDEWDNIYTLQATPTLPARDVHSLRETSTVFVRDRQ